jgi:hypothetical protein
MLDPERRTYLVDVEWTRRAQVKVEASSAEEAQAAVQEASNDDADRWTYDSIDEEIEASAWAASDDAKPEYGVVDGELLDVANGDYQERLQADAACPPDHLTLPLFPEA